MTPKYEGYGYMSEALTTMLNYGKENDVIKVIADTNVDNIKSQNVLLRCGFVLDKKDSKKCVFSKYL